MSNKQKVLDVIRQRPGVRAPEIVDATGIDNPQSYIVGEIDRMEVLVEKIPIEGMRSVNAFRINPANPPDAAMSPRSRAVRAVVDRDGVEPVAASHAASRAGRRLPAFPQPTYGHFYEQD